MSPIATPSVNVEILAPGAPAEPFTPAASWAERARRFVAGLGRDGTGAHVDNARAEVRILRVGEHMLPLVLPHSGRLQAEPMAHVCSPRSHYIRYSRQEMTRRHPRFGAAFGAALWPLDLAIRPAAAQVVYVDNWLLATNPVEPLTSPELGHVTASLRDAFPAAAIVFPNVNPTLDPGWSRLLADAGYRLVRSRRVFCGPREPAATQRIENVRRDAHLAGRMGYTTLRDPSVLRQHVDRITRLYRELYLAKHSRLNPGFTARFFAMLLEQNVLELAAQVRDDTVDAFAMWFAKDGLLTGVALGYDLEKPRSLGLYRQAFSLLVTEARRRGLRLHMSAGAEQFKVHRGALGMEEYDAVFDRHLPPRQRLGWRLLQAAGELAARRKLPRVPRRGRPPTLDSSMAPAHRWR